MLTDAPGFVDAENHDYRLTKTSPAVGAGFDPGTANGSKLLPELQYRHPLGGEERPIKGRVDAGAYQAPD